MSEILLRHEIPIRLIAFFGVLGANPAFEARGVFRRHQPGLGWGASPYDHDLHSIRPGRRYIHCPGNDSLIRSLGKMEPQK